MSLAITSGPKNRVLLLGRKPDGSLSAFTGPMDRPQAVDFSGGCLVVSDRVQLWRFENSLGAGETLEGADALYVPRAAQTTGDLDVHDVVWAAEGKELFVNTRFSCLARPSQRYSFEFVWKPPFISELVPEDRCHLTGVATENGVARYVSAAGASDVRLGWETNPWDHGCLIDVQTNAVVGSNLSLPHSPRLERGHLWLLNSGTGGFGYMDLASGKFEEVVFCGGYLRGLAIHGGYAVIGVSHPPVGQSYAMSCPLRGRLEAGRSSTWSGLAVVDLQSGRLVHQARLDGWEISDVSVLPGVQSPRLLSNRSPQIGQHVSFLMGDEVVRHSPRPDHGPGEKRAPVTGQGSFGLGAVPRVEGAYRLVESVEMQVSQVAARLEHLTFPSLRQRIQTQRLHEPLYSVAVTCGGDFVGLALAQGTPDHSSSEILSLYVRRDHRGRGLSRALLAGLERLLARQGYPRVELAYRSDWPACPILERRLQQLGWESPRTNLMLGKFSASEARFQETPLPGYRLPDGFEIVPWADLTKEDLDTLAADENPDYPNELTPLENPQWIEPSTSLALRCQGQIIGWLVTHRLNPNTIQYTRLHVDPPYQRLGRGLALLAAAIQKQIEAKIPFGVFQVRIDNPHMQRLVQRRFHPYLCAWTESRRSEKRLGTGPVKDGPARSDPAATLPQNMTLL